MTYDQNPLPPPRGTPFQKMLALPVTEGSWRESHQYLCVHCFNNAVHHPYTNDIWGCRVCGTTTTQLRDNFVASFRRESDAEALPARTRPRSRTMFEPSDRVPEPPPPDEVQLPEFGVALQRVAKGDRAVDPADRKNLGLRTKLGGIPDWIQQDATPTCGTCKTLMTFVAQIDSLEHLSMANPIGMDVKNRDPAKKPWMFGDVGMIYVFYCFDCAETASAFQQY